MNIHDINMMIEKNSALMLYFSSKDCNVCEALKPKIKESFTTKFPLIKQVYIDVPNNKETAAHFSVFSVPTILVFFDKKEFFRKSRNLSLSLFVDEIKRVYNIMHS